MRKKLLYLLFTAVLAACLSLVYHRGGNYCPASLDSDCQIEPATRGFPFPILFLGGLGLLELAKTIMQIFGFFADTFFYFILFSTFYFAYSKLFGKEKKK